ncbi:hypothetical protein JCM7447_00820 [Corynebacterium amycolatum]
MRAAAGELVDGVVPDSCGTAENLGLRDKPNPGHTPTGHASCYLSQKLTGCKCETVRVYDILKPFFGPFLS